MKSRILLNAGLTALGLALASTGAHAISRYNSTSMTCAAIWSAIGNEGAVILRWTQAPNIQRYNRFVAGDGFCDPGERALPANVPSADRASCPVRECRKYEPEFDFFFWQQRR